MLPVIPLTQPYNGAPWNYTGTESVATIPAGVVDWVLPELREAATPAQALPATKLAGWPKACFLNGARLFGLGYQFWLRYRNYENNVLNMSN